MRWIAAALVVAGCGGAEPTVPDAAGAPDAASVQSDAAPADAGFPHAGFGVLSGDCDVIDTELSSPEPSLFRSAIDFEREYTDGDLALLTPGGQEIITDGNAGGSSILSEAFAYELFARCEDAVLLATENEVVYDVDGKKTDFLAAVDGLRLGVSVTRAVAFPFEDPYTEGDAIALLDGKLADILESTANVSDQHRWVKQALAVLAYGPQHADVLETALDSIDPDTVADTIVWILVTDGADGFIY